MDKLAAIEQQVLAAPDQQISLTDPDSRSMATSGRGSGVVGYNEQTAIDTEHHLIVAHEVTNVGNDTAHLSNIAVQSKAALGVENTAEEHGQKLHRYWTDARHTCPIKAQFTTGKERRITRWEHEEVVEAVQARLDKNPGAMCTRRETVEHPFGTMKMRMGATHLTGY